MIGTPVGDEIKDPARKSCHSTIMPQEEHIDLRLDNAEMELLPDIFNDLDIDFSRDPKASEAYIADRRNQRKIREATEMLRKNLTLMSPLREGKKLLVLDIDYSKMNLVTLIIDNSLASYSYLGYKTINRRSVTPNGMCTSQAT